MSESYEIFEKWVDKFRPQMDTDEEVTIPVKNLDTFGKMIVRAKLGSSKQTLSNSKAVRVVNDMGEKRGELYMKIIKELDESEANLSVGM